MIKEAFEEYAYIKGSLRNFLVENLELSIGIIKDPIGRIKGCAQRVTVLKAFELLVFNIIILYVFNIPFMAFKGIDWYNPKCLILYIVESLLIYSLAILVFIVICNYFLSKIKAAFILKLILLSAPLNIYVMVIQIIALTFFFKIESVDVYVMYPFNYNMFIGYFWLPFFNMASRDLDFVNTYSYTSTQYIVMIVRSLIYMYLLWIYVYLLYCKVKIYSILRICVTIFVISILMAISSDILLPLKRKIDPVIWKSQKDDSASILESLVKFYNENKTK